MTSAAGVSYQRVKIIDSHTEGEPTRAVVSGGPNLGRGSVESLLETFRREHDGFRTAVLDEPRGSPVAVGALLCPSQQPATTGVIFFNNRGFLGMCGHGTIGVLVTLAHLGRIGPGEHVLETPVGPIRAILHDNNQASFTNVPSFRYRTAVAVAVPEYGNIVGDVAWGGNWFFLVNEAPVELLPHNVEALTEFTWRIRGALDREGITGEGGAEIDHIEISGPPVRADADGRNFVLCPGKMYDRSPCGTGTSAKMACLLADGRLKEGDLWRQEGILGTRFEGVATIRAGKLCPTIRGSAYITGESNLLFDPLDPLSQRLDA